MEHHIEAEIRFLAPEEDGRDRPVRQGYRPQFHYDGADWDGFPTFETTDEWIHPGQTVRARIWFTRPDVHLGKLYPGKQFELREGALVVARGRVTQIFGWE